MNIQLEDNKRTAILNSTLTLVKEHGFHGTPMSQIAKNANVAAGTIYHYFDSKETLMVELHRYTKNKLGEAIVKDDDDTKPYKERFFQFMLNHYHYYIENDAALYFLEQYINSPYAKNFPDKGTNAFTEIIIPFFTKGIEEGYIKNIDSRLLWPTIRGTLVAAATFKLSEHMLYSEEDILEVVTIIWDGVKKQ